MGWLLLFVDATVLIGLISKISDEDVNIRTAMGIAFGAALGVNGLARVLIPSMGLWGLVVAANVIGLLVGVLISALYGAEIKRSFTAAGIFVLVHLCGAFLIVWLMHSYSRVLVWSGAAMAIDIQCSCGKQLSAPDAAAGRRGKCPKCGSTLLIPQPMAAAMAAELTLPDDLETAAAPSLSVDDGIDDEYRVKPDPSSPPPLPARTIPRVARPPQACPSCGQTLPGNAKICVPCGINLRTGRSLITSQAIDEEDLYERVDQVVKYLSWILWFGIFPIASDAYGKFKPYALWAISAVIVVVSVMYWVVGWTDGQAEIEPFGPWPDLLLWAGSWPNQFIGDFQREFHWYQLFTNTLLHAGWEHLGGNMVFLLVFGQRINAVFGQWKTAVMYVVLAVAASLVFYISRLGHTVIPALGASGAIMGLAGMYFVLLPASRVHMIIWLRAGIFTGFQRYTKYFVVRGWGVLLFYLAFDIVATVFRWSDGTAHWAHLGGFICGAILALVLLLTRNVNMHGADIISVVLGRHAWKLLGKPAEKADA